MPLPVQTNVDEVRELLHHILAEPRRQWRVVACSVLALGRGIC